MKEFWNQRYKDERYAFGEEPNEYLKEQLGILSPGKILFPAEGEGRNAVFAARMGWDVSAFDISEEGKKKAEQLAKKHGVKIDYTIMYMDQVDFDEGCFDAIALVYAHFHENVRNNYHQKINRWLKPGGHLILEAFSKEHIHFNTLNPAVGGPKTLDMLYSVEDIRLDFPDHKVLDLSKEEIMLNEGIYHVGKGAVVRYHGQKM